MEFWGFEVANKDKIDKAIEKADPTLKKIKKKTKAEKRREAIARNAKEMMSSVKTY